MGDVDSWYGRVVVVRSWMFVEGSWGRSSRWMQLDDRCGKLRSVESLVNRFPGFDSTLG